MLGNYVDSLPNLRFWLPHTHTHKHCIPENINKVLLGICCDHIESDLHISFRVTSLALRQSNDIASSSNYNDVIMSMMASLITSLTSVYSTVYSRYRSKKTSKLRVTGLCEGNSQVTSEFPTQRASNIENVSIWWHHHDMHTHTEYIPSNISWSILYCVLLWLCCM